MNTPLRPQAIGSAVPMEKVDYLYSAYARNADLAYEVGALRGAIETALLAFELGAPKDAENWLRRTLAAHAEREANTANWNRAKDIARRHPVDSREEAK